MKAKLTGMAVTLTLVFSDESHREAFMKQEGLLRTEARRADYEHRRSAQDLIYLVDAIESD